MKTFTTDAINIKSYPLSENDNIIIMLSKDKGLIKGIAKGAKRPKSKLGARMHMFVANRLMLNVGKNLDTIAEAQAINPFNKLRYDLDKLTYAMYVAEIIGNFCTDNKESSENSSIYDIFYKTLENISSSENRIQIVLCVLKFQLKFMQILGTGLELEHCLICSKKIEDASILSVQNGGVMCTSCAREGLHKIKLHSKMREFLYALLNTSLDEKTKYDDLTTEKVSESCFNLLKKYIDSQSARETKSAKLLNITKVS